MPLSIDPVCGVEVEVENARAEGRRVEFEGRGYVFCSESCQHNFQAAPLYYTGAARQRRADAPYDYPCEDWE